MNLLTDETLKWLRKEYPTGTEVVLDKMDDPQAPPIGTHGRVTLVDDAGTVHIEWDNGSSLGAVYKEDRIHKIMK